MIQFRSPRNLALLALGLVATLAGYLLIAPGVALPTRWGLDLQPTSYLPRNTALLQMPAAIAVIWVIYFAVDRWGSKDRQPSRVKSLNWVLTGVTGFLVAVQILTVIIGLGASRGA